MSFFSLLTVLQQIHHCCQALDDKKAANIRVLEVALVSTATDYLVIASGNSEPHLKTLCESVESVLKHQGITVLGVQKTPGSGWAVVDAFDFMVHLFLDEQRGFYDLEALWKDGKALDWQALLTHGGSRTALHSGT